MKVSVVVARVVFFSLLFAPLLLQGGPTLPAAQVSPTAPSYSPPAIPTYTRPAIPVYNPPSPPVYSPLGYRTYTLPASPTYTAPCVLPYGASTAVPAGWSPTPTETPTTPLPYYPSDSWSGYYYGGFSSSFSDLTTSLYLGTTAWPNTTISTPPSTPLPGWRPRRPTHIWYVTPPGYNMPSPLDYTLPSAPTMPMPPTVP